MSGPAAEDRARDAAVAPSEQVDLFAVQPRISLEEYLDETQFVAHHRSLGQRLARLRSDPRSVPALAVWPEYVATFLVLEGGHAEVQGCTTVEQVLRRVVVRRLPSLARTVLRYRNWSLTPAVLTMLAPRAHEIYVRTFSAIARDFDMWVVAGSGLFPRNAPGEQARLIPQGRGVYNTSYTFSPSGALSLVTRKVNLVPTQEDTLGISPAPLGELGVVQTTFGRLGTLVCYDGFHEPHTSHEPGWQRCAPVLDRLGASVIAQPSANAWAWDAPWAFNEPGEHQLRSEQCFGEGLAREMKELSTVRYAVNAQLVGRLLDNVFEAPSSILERDGDEVRVIAISADPRSEDVVHALVRADPEGNGGAARGSP